NAKLIGGYNPLDWQSTEYWGATLDSFIFSFTNQENIDSGYIARIRKNFSKFAIYNRIDVGPAFGGGWNLGIQSNIMSKCNGYTYPGVDTIFAEKNNIKKILLDYEVFQERILRTSINFRSKASIISTMTLTFDSQSAAIRHRPNTNYAYES
ncbi:16947_t:CDS:2, partial [Funneliformis caledonium]